MVYTKCNPNFQSQYCYLDNQSIHIDDYINKRSSYEKKTVFCNKGHPLVFVNSENRKKHFRHKNTSDLEGHAMSDWHAEWQGHFPNTEVTFARKEGQVRERRADVVLNDTTIVELQHSDIKPEEVFSRKNDYSLHGKEITWIIDGTNVEVKYLENSQRYFLYFLADTWKYRSFDLYDFIYLDVNGSIYKVFPKLVKNGMTDVSAPKAKDEFISSLFNGASLWDDTTPPQCELYVKQQGAGNGKTFGIIQSIKDPAFSHYKTFIYVTKQHSAKYIMFNELREQINGKIDIDGNYSLEPQFTDFEATDKSNPQNKKHYVYHMTNKETGDIKQIVFATIDSFMYSIAEQNASAYDTFLGIVNNIINDDPNNSMLKLSSNSTMRFAQEMRKINKETIFIVDECQDLSHEYARAIIKIMRTTYMDCLVVGDILQSIHHEQNAFRFFLAETNDNDIAPYIKRTKLQPINICQRFKKDELVNFVNKVVNFNYNSLNLPLVQAAKPVHDDETSIHFFPSYNRKSDEESVNESNEEEDDNLQRTTKDIDQIMQLYETEVLENNRKPNNFLIVTPFTSNNILAQELELRIHLFWEAQLNASDSSFNRYAIFHRSQEGTSINLDESKDSTRIVSCHSAKGDGREVVFLVGFTEKAITTFSKSNDTLIFESMINVMMTRMKEKLYIQYLPNGDTLHKRYYDYCCSLEDRTFDIIPVLPVINKYMTLNKLLSCMNGEENWKFFGPIAEKANIVSVESSSHEKRILDMTHHTIRAHIMDMLFMICIVRKERKLYDRKKQHLRIFEDISKLALRYFADYTKYSNAIQDLKNAKSDTRKFFPILQLKGRTLQGISYYEVICEFMKNIITFTHDFANKKTNRCPCPLECIVLYFMIENLRNGRKSNITIFFLYDILDKYEHGFKNHQVHDGCCCSKFFKQSSDQPSNMDIFHVNHYDVMQNTEKNLNEIYTRNSKIAWLNNHSVYFDGDDKDFALYQPIRFHGYDDEKQEILLCYLKPQYNSLNEKETLMNIVIDTWLMLNYEKKDENIVKYYGKKIKACIVSLDYECPVYIDIENIIKEKNEYIRQELFKRWQYLLSQSHPAVYHFYSYYRNQMNKKSCSLFCKEFNKKIKKHYEGKHASFEATYVKDFFTGYLFIDNDRMSPSKKENNLKDYDVKETFLDDMKHKLGKDLADYMRIPEEDDGNNDEDDDDEDDDANEV
jgi:hypothetical protein